MTTVYHVYVGAVEYAVEEPANLESAQKLVAFLKRVGKSNIEPQTWEQVIEDSWSLIPERQPA